MTLRGFNVSYKIKGHHNEGLNYSRPRVIRKDTIIGEGGDEFICF